MCQRCIAFASFKKGKTLLAEIAPANIPVCEMCYDRTTKSERGPSMSGRWVNTFLFPLTLRNYGTMKEFYTKKAYWYFPESLVYTMVFIYK